MVRVRRVCSQRFFRALSLTDQSLLCYNLHAGHGQILRIVGLASALVEMYFLTVSCR